MPASDRYLLGVPGLQGCSFVTLVQFMRVCEVELFAAIRDTKWKG
jgi:hypothetical protein